MSSARLPIAGPRASIFRTFSPSHTRISRLLRTFFPSLTSSFPLFLSYSFSLLALAAFICRMSVSSSFYYGASAASGYTLHFFWSRISLKTCEKWQYIFSRSDNKNIAAKLQERTFHSNLEWILTVSECFSNRLKRTCSCDGGVHSTLKIVCPDEVAALQLAVIQKHC